MKMKKVSRHLHQNGPVEMKASETMMKKKKKKNWKQTKKKTKKKKKSKGHE